MTAARAAGSNSPTGVAPFTGRPGRVPPWRCLHRPSRRLTAGGNRERCGSCGALIQRESTR